MKASIKKWPSLPGKTLALVTLMVAGSAHAAFPETLGSLTQDEFLELSKNLSAATHYKSVSPAEALGAFGLDVGAELSSTEADTALFEAASGGSMDGGRLMISRVHVHKGLPLGFDLGASLGKLLETDFTIIGGELRYSLVDGDALTPAVGLRASYSQLQGVTELDLNSAALELTISKGFLMFTPYAGVGVVRTNANPNLQDASELRSDTLDQRKMYAGLTVNLGFALTIEAERTGDFQTYTAKAGIRF